MEYFNALALGVIATDARLGITHINRWLLERFQHSQDRYIGVPLAQAFPQLEERGLLAAYEHVLETGQPMTLSYIIHKYFLKFELPPQSGLEFMPQSVTITPLVEGNELAGTLTTIRDISDRVLDENQLRRANQRLETLLRVARLLGNQLALQPLLDSVVNLLMDIFNADGALFERPEAHSGRFRVAAQKGVLPAPGAVLRADVRIRGRQEGSIQVFGNPGRRFRRDDQELLDSLAAQIALALENALLYAHQQQLAITDGLTGLANRRRFDEELAYYMQRDAYQAQPTALLMVDIDDFKGFNDTYGHPAGDRLLKAVGDVFAKNLRLHDVAARYGGEEFALILPTTGRAEARRIAERLRGLAAEAMSALIPPQPLFSGPSRSAIARVTISLGLAVSPEDGSQPETLIHSADQALYAAKSAGKDRVREIEH